ncbi:MAG: AMP-binding protein [Longimicrobiaceae bacterium]
MTSPVAATLHHLLEQVAERDPSAPALIDAEGTVTHGELHRAANRLAHHLRALEVGLETPVAVLLPRTRQLPVALLAALKAGGVTLALELTLPPARLRYMLADARVPLLLTDEATWAALGGGVTDRSWPGRAGRRAGRRPPHRRRGAALLARVPQRRGGRADAGGERQGTGCGEQGTASGSVTEAVACCPL